MWKPSGTSTASGGRAVSPPLTTLFFCLVRHLSVPPVFLGFLLAVSSSLRLSLSWLSRIGWDTTMGQWGPAREPPDRPEASVMTRRKRSLPVSFDDGPPSRAVPRTSTSPLSSAWCVKATLAVTALRWAASRSAISDSSLRHAAGNRHPPPPHSTLIHSLPFPSLPFLQPLRSSLVSQCNA